LTTFIILFMGLANFSFVESRYKYTSSQMSPFHNKFRSARDTTHEGDTISVEAQFPGGSDAWMRYLIRNLRYPREAVNNRIQGTVILNFIIDEKGRIKNINATGPTNGGLREEAIRLLRQSGKWIPAKINDEPVPSSKMQPFTFKLE